MPGYLRELDVPRVQGASSEGVSYIVFLRCHSVVLTLHADLILDVVCIPQKADLSLLIGFRRDGHLDCELRSKVEGMPPGSVALNSS